MNLDDTDLYERWLEANPAHPCFPTLLNSAGWVAWCEAASQGIPANSQMFHKTEAARLVPARADFLPWGSVERHRALSPDTTAEPVWDAVSFTIEPPPSNLNQRPRRRTRRARRRRQADADGFRWLVNPGAGGPTPKHWRLHYRRYSSTRPADKTTAAALEAAARGNSAAGPELPAQTQLQLPMISSSRETDKHAQGMAQARLRGRTMGGLMSAFGVDVGGMLAIGNDGLIAAASFGVPAAILGAGIILAPTIANKIARRTGLRSFDVVTPEDSRIYLAAFLTFYIAHRDELGDSADQIILSTWRALYAAADADVTVAAVWERLANKLGHHVAVLASACGIILANRETAHTAAEPTRAERERQALATLDDGPADDELHDLVEQLDREAEATRYGRRRIENRTDTSAAEQLRASTETDNSDHQ